VLSFGVPPPDGTSVTLADGQLTVPRLALRFTN
jgi:hypothetical protein